HRAARAAVTPHRSGETNAGLSSTSPRPRRSAALPVGVAALAAAAILGPYLAWRAGRQPPPATTTSAEAASTSAAPAAPAASSAGALPAENPTAAATMSAPMVAPVST